MATNTKKTITKTTPVATTSLTKTTPETATPATETVKEKKKFAPDELIPCISITPGEMFVKGAKTQTLYTFAEMDDIVEIEFRDLDYAARSKDVMMYKPRYIVQDADFIALHPALDEVYSKLHTTADLKDILKMTPSQMEKIIPTLPLGAQDALKTIAATMVDEGNLDSVKRLQVLDSIFGTEMLSKLA